MKSEGETLTHKKKSSKICFDKKMTNTGGKSFLLTTNLYKNPNYTALLGHNKYNPACKAYVDPEKEAIKRQDKIEPNNTQWSKFTLMIPTQICHIQEKTVWK